MNRRASALWTRTTAPAIPLKSVLVVTLGATLDDYADKVIVGYGAAQLTVATIAHFDWPTLTADSA